MQGQSIEFFSNGKLLLTGEYFVLHGAKALALPVRLGQYLRVTFSEEKSNETFFSWSARYKQEEWFSARISCTDFYIEQTSDENISQTLVQILKTIRELNPEFRIAPGTNVETVLEFDPKWGLGSSSTLVANLSEWAGVDPYLLNERVFHGSGFDIACARAKGPIFYQKGMTVELVRLDWPFTSSLFLIYSGQKRNTRSAIGSLFPDRMMESQLGRISSLSQNLVSCISLFDFQKLMHEHEREVSEFIGQMPVQQELFPDFSGAIKSLGAWGGDFLLVATDWGEERMRNYFAQRGLLLVFRWNELVLNYTQ